VTRSAIRKALGINNQPVVFYDARMRRENRYACVHTRVHKHLSQHLGGSLMTLTFRGGRGRTKERRAKKLLSNFDARARAHFPEETVPLFCDPDISLDIYLFSLFMFQVSLSRVIYEIRVSAIGLEIYNSCAPMQQPRGDRK